MTTKANQINNEKINLNNSNSVVDGVKILSEITKKDIEKSYNIDTVKGTEAYFSIRYGWTLRRSKD